MDLQTLPDAAFGEAIAAAAEAMDLAALSRLAEAAHARPPAVRMAVADAYAGCLGQLEMDLATGKLEGAGLDAELIEGVRACRLLVPDDPDYAVREAYLRVARAGEAAVPDAAARSDLDEAERLATALIAGWDGMRSRGPDEAVLDGNLLTPRGVRCDDAYRVRAQARCVLARRSPAVLAAALLVDAGVDWQMACDQHLDEHDLAAWWHACGRLGDGPDRLHRDLAAAAVAGFDAYAQRRIAAEPAVARHWAAMFTRAAESDDALLSRAAQLWRAYAVDPSLPPQQASSVGHGIRACGLRLGDAGLLHLALAVFEDLRVRAPTNFHIGYAAEICVDLADLPATTPERARGWYDRAVAIHRAQTMPDDDLHLGMLYPGLLLARAARFGFPPGHPDLEEAWRISARMIAVAGATYQTPHEHAARARLLQGRDDEAAAVLRAALAGAGPAGLDGLLRRQWFRDLDPVRAAQLRARLAAG